jgi:hypothetical protein
MKLGLDTITSLGPDGNDKQRFSTALFATKDRHSVLGTYGFDKNGDTTLTVLRPVQRRLGRHPVFVKTLTPPAVGVSASELGNHRGRGRRGRLLPIA